MRFSVHTGGSATGSRKHTIHLGGGASPPVTTGFGLQLHDELVADEWGCFARVRASTRLLIADQGQNRLEHQATVANFLAVAGWQVNRWLDEKLLAWTALLS